MDEHADRIARWSAAYEVANGKPSEGRVIYERGWYRFYSKFGFHQVNYRKDKLEDMIRNLEWRATTDGRQYFKTA